MMAMRFSAWETQTQKWTTPLVKMSPNTSWPASTIQRDPRIRSWDSEVIISLTTRSLDFCVITPESQLESTQLPSTRPKGYSKIHRPRRKSFRKEAPSLLIFGFCYDMCKVKVDFGDLLVNCTMTSFPKSYQLQLKDTSRVYSRGKTS